MNKQILSLVFFFTGFSYQAFAIDYCEDFSAFLKAKSPLSVDGLLSEMAKTPQWNAVLGNYIFMYKSKSLQQATPTDPRVIVYAPDATMLFAFLNGPQNGRDAVELICWRPARKVFEFFELNFDGKQSPNMDAKNANPGKCLLCHGTNPRPNWEAYNFWSGSFGSLSRGDNSHMRTDMQEYKYYVDFMNGHRHSGRYQYLPAETPPISRGDKMVEFTNSYSHEPNRTILDQLTPLNVARIGNIVTSHPLFQAFQPAFQCLSPSFDIESFMPPQLKNGGLSYVQTRQEIIETHRREFEKRLADLAPFNAQVPGDTDRMPMDFVTYNQSKTLSDETVARLRYLLDRMGISFSRLSYGFDSGTYDFTSGSYPVGYVPIQAIGLGVPKTSQSCDDLQAESLRRLKDVPMPTPATPPIPTSGDPLNQDQKDAALAFLQGKCLTCHGVTQPSLPFGSETELKSAFSQTPDLLATLTNRLLGVNLGGRPQMPLGDPLPVDDQIRMVEYLRQVDSEKPNFVSN